METVKCNYCNAELKRYPSAIKNLNFCNLTHYHYYFRDKNNKYVNCGDYTELYINDDEKVFKILIDTEDVEKAKKYTWHLINKNRNITYLGTKVNGKKLTFHRYIMNCPENMIIDHINRNTFDNRKQNLRICTDFENMQNTSMYKNNKSGIKNIHWNNCIKRWIFQYKRYKNITTFTFKTKEEAINKKKEVFGYV